LAVPVNEVYNNVHSYSGFPLILATYFFSFQIFCDFAGYSIIAIGSARVMGYDLMHNFNRPFSARSISDFWNRWHISLTTWFRDYVFYSLTLTGKTQSTARLYFTIFFVFLVSGLWHGANWTFVIWGALHGFYLLFAMWTRSWRQRLSKISHLSKYPVLDKIVDILVTYHLVFVAWVFFRANSVGDAFYILTHLFSGFEFNLNAINGFSSSAALLAIFLLGVMELIQWIQSQEKVQNWFYMGPIWVRWPAYYAILFAITTLGVFGGQQFIYFQF
jgi:alginate O-acetyltransferase complex protein AlgI